MLLLLFGAQEEAELCERARVEKNVMHAQAERLARANSLRKQQLQARNNKELSRVSISISISLSRSKFKPRTPQLCGSIEAAAILTRPGASLGVFRCEVR